MRMNIMIDQISKLIDEYGNWLRNSTALLVVGDMVEITTPFLDRHNDCMQIYVREIDSGQFLLTDVGETIDDLEMSGVSLTTSKRKEQLKVATAGFGVNVENRALSVTASSEEFPLAMNNLVQAMLAINDLHYVARPSAKPGNYQTDRMANEAHEQLSLPNIFPSEVGEWLESEKYEIERDVSYTGKLSGDYNFNYVIRESSRYPARFVQPIIDSERLAAQQFAIAWTEFDSKPNNSKAFAVLDDRKRKIPPGLEDGLVGYGIKPVPWTARGRPNEILAA